MKRMNLLLLLILLVGGNTKAQKVIPVPDYRKQQQLPDINTRQQKDKDVTVYRALLMRDFYVTIIYRKDADALKGYKTYLEAKDNFDKASYRWLNDSTASITLINTKNKQTQTYKVSGYGSTTTLNTTD